MSLIFPKKEILYAPMLGTLGGGSARGFGRGGGASALYEFTSFQFFGYSGGNEEYRGILYNDAISLYQGLYPSQNWYLDTNFFSMSQRGYQKWTVPITGNYQIEARGAQGGYATYNTSSPYQGYGGEAQGIFNLQAGQVITIACGHEGHSSAYQYHASGGGGSFVVADGGDYANASLSDVLVVGGGGGGGFGTNLTDSNDSHGGNTGSTGYGGSSLYETRQTTLGAGGRAGRLTDGGGGFIGNGLSIGTADSTSNHGYFGYSYINGLEGGAGNTGQDSHACTGNSLGTMYGGFGGGAGGSYAANGAGGGYTGGAGGDGCNPNGGGGGGASYVNTSSPYYSSGSQYTSGMNQTHGRVEVVFLG